MSLVAGDRGRGCHLPPCQLPHQPLRPRLCLHHQPAEVEVEKRSHLLRAFPRHRGLGSGCFLRGNKLMS